MELALYCPDCGYYEKEKDIVGRRGDFFTSVSVGSLFGELLAYQFAGWLESEIKGATPGIRLVEAGAHDGRLAGDILRWLRDRRKEAFGKLEYYIVEPSSRRREWQRKELAEFGEVVRWIPEIRALDQVPGSLPAVIFSNELLDAMPVHRFGWDAKSKRWFEWGVALEASRFAWGRMPESESHVSRPAASKGSEEGFTFHGLDVHELSDVLPDGFTTEFSPAAEKWWRDAAGVLKQGKLLTIDYGLNAEEFFTPERKEGTLKSYHRHHLMNDILANPGEQDITAQVNFTAIQTAGEAAGLWTEYFGSQTKFLTQIAERAWGRAEVFGEWDAARTRQFQTLTHPEHLGRSFRVLVQSRQSGD